MIDGERQRIRQRATATITFTPTDADGEPGADPGTVTVGIVSSDGTVVVAAGTATGSTGVNRTYALTATHTANLDVLTATWTAAGTTIGITSYDIVGGYYFTIAELRSGEPSTRAEAKYSDAEIIAARNDTEVFFERVQTVSWVPRLSTTPRTPVDGLWQIPLPHPFLRVVRWLRIWTSTTTYTSLTAAQCAAIAPSDTGLVLLPYTVWTSYGVEIGYEHGNDAPPRDVKRAAMRYCRVLLNSSLEPSRTQPFISDVGLLPPERVGTARRPTGYDEIDEVLMSPRYNFAGPPIA